MAPTPEASPASAHRVRDGALVAAGLCGAAAVGWVHRSHPVGALALAAVIGVATWLSVIDAREHRLPNRIVGPLAAAVTVGLLVAGPVAGDLSRTGRAIGFGVAASLVLLAANLLGGLGMGDVKYGYPVAATAGWFGWDALFVAIVATTVAGAVVAAIVLARGAGRDHALSYGPFMSLGLLAALLTAGPG